MKEKILWTKNKSKEDTKNIKDVKRNDLRSKCWRIWTNNIQPTMTGNERRRKRSWDENTEVWKTNEDNVDIEKWSSKKKEDCNYDEER